MSNRQSTGPSVRITWLEIVIIVLLLSFMSLIFVAGKTSSIVAAPTGRASATAKTAKAIYNWLQAYAKDNGGRFPEGPHHANEAYRQLFVKGYLDDEQGFTIDRDPWLKHAPGGLQKADNDIGQAPDFKAALAPGECSWAYVTGLTTDSPAHLPLVANAFSDVPGIYSPDPSRRGGVFKGLQAIWVSVGGSAKVAFPGTDFTITKIRDGRPVNIFGAEAGTSPENVKNPAP